MSDIQHLSIIKWVVRPPSLTDKTGLSLCQQVVDTACDVEGTDNLMTDGIEGLIPIESVREAIDLILISLFVSDSTDDPERRYLESIRGRLVSSRADLVWITYKAAL